MRAYRCSRLALTGIIVFSGVVLPVTARAADAASTPAASTPAADPAAATPPPTEEVDVYDEQLPESVVVRGKPRTDDATVITQAEAKLIAGAFGDPFRAVETAPGVVPIASGVPFFYVRGAPPGDVGYFLDGIRVPLLFHLGLGPSVVHPNLIDKVELVPGANAEFGRYAGGVVTGALAGQRDELRVEGNLRLVDTGAFLEVPFDEGRGDALLTGRISYTALLFSLVQSDLVLNYWDYAGRLNYEVAPGQRLGFFAFGAYDYMAEKRVNEDDHLIFDTMFHRINLSYDVDVDPRTRVETDVIFGWDETRLEDNRDVVDKSLDMRMKATKRVSDDFEIRGGVDVTFDDYDIDLAPEADDEDGSFATFFSSRTDIAAGAWVTLPVTLGGRLSMLPGLRADVYASKGEFAIGFDPSISARLEIIPGLALIQSHGLASQPPSFIVAGPGFRPGLDRGGLQRAFSSSIGLEYKPTPDWQFKVVAYRSAFFDFNDALGTSGLADEGFPGGFDTFDKRFGGTSTGLEVMIKKRPTDGLGLVFSYSLGRSERSDGQGNTFPSGFDRTHVASLAMTYEFGKGFRGGIKQLLYTGSPILARTDSGIEVASRLPPFYRLDWRVEKRFNIGKTGWVSLVLEVLNTFLAKETLGQECETTFDANGAAHQECNPSTLGPVTIPSFGVEGGY
ncbi:MAG: TonB-dependent receptor [Polyangiaceae bacterium]